jgi:hypothetical protein
MPNRQPISSNFSAEPPTQWPPGTHVAVRTRFTSRWAEGFVVEEAAERGPARYRLRRLSDNAVLPASFPAEDIRPV